MFSAWIEKSKPWSSVDKFKDPGIKPVCIASIAMMASVIPAAPSVCAIQPLVEEHCVVEGNIEPISLPSIRSLARLDVP